MLKDNVWLKKSFQCVNREGNSCYSLGLRGGNDVTLKIIAVNIIGICCNERYYLLLEKFSERHSGKSFTIFVIFNCCVILKNQTTSSVSVICY